MYINTNKPIKISFSITLFLLMSHIFWGQATEVEKNNIRLFHNEHNMGHIFASPDSSGINLLDSTGLKRLRLNITPTRSRLLIYNQEGIGRVALYHRDDQDAGRLLLLGEGENTLKPTVEIVAGSSTAGSRLLARDSVVLFRQLSEDDVTRFEVITQNKQSIINMMNFAADTVVQIGASPYANISGGFIDLKDDDGNYWLNAFADIDGARGINLNNDQGNSAAVFAVSSVGHGFLRLRDQNENKRVELGTGSASSLTTMNLYESGARIRFLSQDSFELIKLHTPAFTPAIEMKNFQDNDILFLGQQIGDLGGSLSLHSEDGVEKLYLSENLDNSGFSEFYGNNGNLNIRASSLLGSPNNGHFAIYDDLSSQKISAFVTAQRAGRMFVTGANGNNNIVIADVLGQPSRGYINVSNTSGNGRAGLYIDNSEKGVIFGEELALINSSNVTVAGLKFTSGNPELYAHTITGTIKNFKIDHPTKDGKEIVYACVEGPEVAAYIRGNSTLTNGSCYVSLPEFFSVIVDKAGMTVQLTPNSGESKGLAVISKSPSEFTVQELFNGDGNYSFDWEVKARRTGYEDYQVVRDKLPTKNISEIIQAESYTNSSGRQSTPVE